MEHLTRVPPANALAPAGSKGGVLRMHDERLGCGDRLTCEQKVTRGRVFGPENPRRSDLGRHKLLVTVSPETLGELWLELAPVARGEGNIPLTLHVLRARARHRLGGAEGSSAAMWCSRLPRQMKTWS